MCRAHHNRKNAVLGKKKSSFPNSTSSHHNFPCCGNPIRIREPIQFFINPLQLGVTFLYPLKTSENL